MSSQAHNHVLNDHPIKKIYWRMREAAAELGVNSSCIRYWMREFNLEPKKTNFRGDRIFNEADFGRLKLIKTLLRDEGLRIWAVKE